MGTLKERTAKKVVRMTNGGGGKKEASGETGSRDDAASPP